MPAGLRLTGAQLKALIERVLVREGKGGANQAEFSFMQNPYQKSLAGPVGTQLESQMEIPPASQFQKLLTDVQHFPPEVNMRIGDYSQGISPRGPVQGELPMSPSLPSLSGGAIDTRMSRFIPPEAQQGEEPTSIKDLIESILLNRASSAQLQDLVKGGVTPTDTLVSQLYKNRAGEGLPPKPITLPFEKAKEMYLNSKPGTFERNFGRVPEALRLSKTEPGGPQDFTGDMMKGLALERLKNKPPLTPAEQFRLAIVLKEGQSLPSTEAEVRALAGKAGPVATRMFYPNTPLQKALPMPEGMTLPSAGEVAAQAPSLNIPSQALETGNQLAYLWRKAGGARGTFGKLWGSYFNAAKAGQGGKAVAERYKSPYEYYLGTGAQWRKSPGQVMAKRPVEAARLALGWKEYMGGE